jgi:exopolysaccharide biosynthesis polyprenyl glycosylphosphotransferase
MKSNSSLLYNVFLVVGDFFSILLAFVVAYVLRVSLDHHRVAHSISGVTYIQAFFILVPIWILIFALIGLYRNDLIEKRFTEIGKLFIGAFIGILLIIGYSYGLNKVIFPAHLVAFYGFILSFAILVGFRTMARKLKYYLYKIGYGVTNVLIVGDTNLTHYLVESLFDSNTSGYKIVGIVGPSKHLDSKYESIPVYETFEIACEKLGTERIGSIIQTELYSSPANNNMILSYAQTNHCAYRFIPGNTELFVGNLEVELFRSSIPVISVHQTPLIGWGRIAKRIFDTSLSLLILIILSPFLLILIILMLIFDPGSIIFKQKRVTRFNTTFNAYKFRTMKRKLSGRDPIEVFKEMGRDDLAEDFQNSKKLNEDPRISKLGILIRRYSIDEIPQLINVIKGDISLVGPRAVVPEELKYYKDKSSLLLSVKTGITGLAQVSGRSDIDYYERAKIDLYYVQNWSFWLDLTILFKTIRVVLNRGGAR